MDLSIVVPLFNEDESLQELHSWIQRVTTEHNFTYEVIFVDDGSTDNSWKVISELSEKDANVHGIRFRRNYGKSPRFSAVSAKHKATWSSRWMPTCRTRPTKFRNFTA